MKISVLTVILFTVAEASTAFGAPAQTQVETNPAETMDLNKRQVRAMYLGRTRHFESGTRLMLSCMRNGSVHKAFLKEWLGMTPSQFKIHWQKRVFTGQDAMPQFFDSNEKQMEYVANTGGAVGYKPREPKKVERSGPMYFDPKTARYVRRKPS